VESLVGLELGQLVEVNQVVFVERHIDEPDREIGREHREQDPDQIPAGSFEIPTSLIVGPNNPEY